MADATKTKEKTETKETVSKETSLQEANNKTIRNHMLASMGVGAIPIPILDMAGITAIQLRMIQSISKNYDDKFDKKYVTKVISALVAGVGTKSIATGTFGSLVKLIPVIGSVVGAVTYPAVAGATTFALGQVFVRHYESGGTLLTLETAPVKDYFKEQYNEGKERASNIKKAALGKKDS